jgi:hypothetical protein
MKYPAVYVYKKTSDKGQELRYSLRSLENVTNWNGEVFICGDKEGWLNDGVQMIEDFKRSHMKHQDVNNKRRAIAECKRLADDYIYMNDDFIITKPVEIEPLHQGELPETPPKINHWHKIKLRTRDYLVSQGIKKPLDYDIHVPMILNKQKVLQILDICETVDPQKPYAFRSLYGNIHNIGGKFYKDRKTQSNKLLKGELLSTRSFTKELMKLFPDEGRFEGISPKPLVHMIWIGSPLPIKYRLTMKTFENRGYRVKLWTEPPKLVNQKLFDQATSYALKADIMRLEILYQEGGLYCDVDAVMLKPLYTPKDLVTMTSASGYMGNETIYAKKGHPALKEAIEGMQKHYDNLPDEVNIWDIAGATYITPIFEKYDHYKYSKAEIGGKKNNPSIIRHSYDASWAVGIQKADKKPKGAW